MNKKELERRLREESNENIPDLADKILMKAEEEGLFEEREFAPTRREKHVKRSWIRRPIGRIATALATAFVGIAVILPLVFRPSQKDGVTADADATTVCMKINPSVEFTVENDVVTQARSLNQDAAVLLVHNDLEGKLVEEACLQFAAMAADRNLITEEGITLYVSGKDETAVEEKIAQKLKDNDYVFHRGAEEYEEEGEKLASKYQISSGKARLIAEIIKIYPNKYSESRLAKMKIDDLYEILEEYDEDEMEKFIAELGGKYEEEYAKFVEIVSEKLIGYRADLEALNDLPKEERLTEIERFNQTYFLLGEDFLIDLEDDLWEECYEECLEELDEIEADLAKNADEAFFDLFEDWLEEFQENVRGDRFL